MKFEKIMKKFCKDIGLDKNTLLNMMLGTSNLEDSNRKDQNSSKENISMTIGKESGPINTGVAA